MVNKFKSVALAGAAAIAMLATPLAHANLNLSYWNGSSWQVLASSGTDAAVFLGNAGDFNIAIQTANTNNPGTAANAHETSTTDAITNNGTTAETIYLGISQNSFTAPVTPPSIQFSSTVSGTTVGTTAGDSFAFWSCVDQNNNANPGGNSDPTSISGSATLFPLGPSSGSIPVGSAVSFAGPDQRTTIDALSANYTISQVLKVTLNAGDSVNFNGS